MRIKLERCIAFLFLLAASFNLSAQDGGIFLRIEAFKVDDHVVLQWELIDGGQCYDIVVERGSDEETLVSIDTIQGFCGGGVTYQYLDEAPLVFLPNHYRLKSAALEISPVVKVDRRFMETGVSVLVYPHPVRGISSLVFEGDPGKKYQLEIMDASGRMVKKLEGLSGDVIAIDRVDFPRGMLICRLLSDDGEVGVRRMVVE